MSSRPTKILKISAFRDFFVTVPKCQKGAKNRVFTRFLRRIIMFFICVTHTIRIFSAKGHGGGEPMSGFPPWHLQVLLSLQLLRHLLEKIRRPQVKRGFIPNEAADILFGGGVVDFVEAFVQNRLQRLQIKRLRFVKKSRIHQPRSQVRQVCARKLRESRMAIVLPIAVLTYRNFAFLNDESVKIIIA